MSERRIQFSGAEKPPATKRKLAVRQELTVCTSMQEQREALWRRLMIISAARQHHVHKVDMGSGGKQREELTSTSPASAA